METLSSFFVVASMIGVGALCITVLVLRHLSQRLAIVTRQRSRHQWYVVSAAVMISSLLARLLAALEIAMVGAYWALIHDVLLVIGLMIAVRTSVYYWGWLFGERGRQPDQ
jgi:energy-converting hydrogenase Eha subunit A